MKGREKRKERKNLETRKCLGERRKRKGSKPWFGAPGASHGERPS